MQIWKCILLVLAVCVFGVTGCSSLAASAGQKFHASLLTPANHDSNADGDPMAANRNWYRMIH